VGDELGVGGATASAHAGIVSCEVVGERRHEADVPVRGLREVTLAESVSSYELKDVTLGCGPDRFEQVERERVSRWIVSVHESETGVESDRHSASASR
jgi:hypothetical protein